MTNFCGENLKLFQTFDFQINLTTASAKFPFLKLYYSFYYYYYFYYYDDIIIIIFIIMMINMMIIFLHQQQQPHPLSLFFHRYF